MNPTDTHEDLYTAIERTLLRRPDDGRPVIRFGRRSIGASALIEGAGRAAAALAARGVRAGDRVMVQTAKSVEQVMLYLGVLRAGAVHVPLNTAYRGAEIAYFLGDAEPRVFICDPADEPLYRADAAAGGTTLLTLAADGTGSWPAACAAVATPPAPSAVGAHDLASIIYTSGTTGRSKGAMLTHANLLGNARALIDAWGITDADTLVHALPLYHIHGLFVALNTLLLAGGRMHMLGSFDAGAVIDALADATLFMGVPTYYTRLLANPRLTRAAAAPVRAFICGSAPLLPQTFAEFEAATGHRVLERYGMSECGIITSNPLAGERRPGAVGLPLQGVEIRLVDDAGHTVPAGTAGVIEVRGPGVFRGYWRMPEKTAAELHADGFFVTGDIGLIDAAGYLHIVGRAKDMVITGGLNVYPKEIETVLDAVPGVLESAVIGLPHPDFGEAVAAVVCLTDARPAVTPGQLVAAARERLAGFKVPKIVYIVDELPRNAMGKVQKAELRRRYADTFT